METIKVSQIKVGDVIMPPAREVSLWMKRHIHDNGLSESALLQTVKEIYSSADKGGPWICFKSTYSAEWTGNRPTYGMSFRARPDTAWQRLNRSPQC